MVHTSGEQGSKLRQHGTKDPLAARVFKLLRNEFQQEDTNKQRSLSLNRSIVAIIHGPQDDPHASTRRLSPLAEEVFVFTGCQRAGHTVGAETNSEPEPNAARPSHPPPQQRSTKRQHWRCERNWAGRSSVFDHARDLDAAAQLGFFGLGSPTAEWELNAP